MCRIDTDQLTPREIECLRLIAAGKSNRQISRELCITWQTARTHVSRVYAKLGTSVRVEAVRVARQRGVLAAGTYSHTDASGWSIQIAGNTVRICPPDSEDGFSYTLPATVQLFVESIEEATNE